MALAAVLKEGSHKKKPCVHHWVIEAAEGAKSRGVCKHCGEIREFDNYISVDSWVDDVFKIKSPPKPSESDFDKKLARFLV